MRCKDCPNDLGYKAGMHWPPYKPTCKIGKRPVITKDGYLYNRKRNAGSVVKANQGQGLRGNSILSPDGSLPDPALEVRGWIGLNVLGQKIFGQ